jgi:hypothetical protein
VFRVRYELNFYILIRRNYISKVLRGIWFLWRTYFLVIIHFIICLQLYLFRILVLACNRPVLLANTKILNVLNNYYYVSSRNAQLLCVQLLFQSPIYSGCASAFVNADSKLIHTFINLSLS